LREDLLLDLEEKKLLKKSLKVLENNIYSMKILKKNAFTLVELIIVITILSILATLAFVSFKNYLISANDSVSLSQLKATSQALESYAIKV
jgi:prepilin-type N-terminal cleavage/methylation domain-containing protein